jgi:hypothetical protein
MAKREFIETRQKNTTLEWWDECRLIDCYFTENGIF